VGKVCLVLGGVLAMGILIPNPMNERWLFLIMGGAIIALGLTLVSLGKKSLKKMEAVS
jgi:cytochrome c biogenesis protein CcdA